MLYGVATENPWRRVLVIATPRGLFPLGTGRELVLRECRDEDICGLPHFLRDGGARPLLWGISMPEEGRPLLLLDRDALAAHGSNSSRRGWAGFLDRGLGDAPSGGARDSFRG